MAPDSDELRVLRDAVRILKARPPGDPLGWAGLASAHAVACDTLDPGVQVHFGWWFLPWHRAELYVAEKWLQAAVNEPKLALPYWDWNRFPTIPANYLRSDNPLNDDTRERGPNDPIPPNLVDVSAVMTAATFAAFGGQRFPTNPSQPQRPGSLELRPHNNVHGWVGGNMGFFDTAGLDPLFYAHHANVDRLWDVWVRSDPGHVNPPDAEWLDREFEFRGPTGQPVRVAIREVLMTENLGYRYADPSHEVRLAGGGAGEGPVVVAGPVSTKRVALPPEVVEKVTGAAGKAPRDRARVAIRLGGVKLPSQPTTFNVFVNRPDANAETPPEGESFAGTFTLIPVGRGQHGKAGRSIDVALDISAAAPQLLRASPELAVRVVPVSLRQGKQPERITIDAIDVVVGQ